MKTSIKVKKLWYGPIEADGGISTQLTELQIGTREATCQFNGSDADTTTYKNVLGDVVESAIVKGDTTMNFQFADFDAEVIADMIGGVVVEDADSIRFESPANPNQSIERSILFLTDKNVLVSLPRCSFDAFPIMNDDDLHYFQVNTTVLTPSKVGEPTYAMDLIKAAAISNAEITAFSMEEQTGPATITSGTGEIDIEVANGTDVTDLVPTIAISLGASIAPVNKVAQDFTNPVEYVVTAADGTTKTWTVTVTVAA